MPRVNLFIADDVGLGKTIEAGLIARELLIRKKANYILIACPPSMLTQWQDELSTRFGLGFQILDKEWIQTIRQQRGFSANPFAAHSRFLISHRLLIDETYTAPLRDFLGDNLPGSLLILDEAHHAAPSSGAKYSKDSQFTEALRDLSPRFEHRLFLSATPHNGHSSSFTSLLELLDPQRFIRGVEPSSKNLSDVMVRRLKEDLRRIQGGFPERKVIQIDLSNLPADSPELLLPQLLNDYDHLRRHRLSTTAKHIQAASALLISGLQQRLLSSITAFARTLSVHKRYIKKQSEKHAPTAFPLLSAAPGADDENANLPGIDLAKEEDNQTAAATAITSLNSTQAEIDLLDKMESLAQSARYRPDARVIHIRNWILDNCITNNTWNHRRAIIFTTYEDTLGYLRDQLEELLTPYGDPARRIGIYRGETSRADRQSLKDAFNAPPDRHPIRILIATDAAREGLNLQAHCHDLFHFDVPWNPARLEQRNGRIDRKLQPAPEVYCYYFNYTQRPEDRILSTLVNKTETIRKQLGSISQVLESRLTLTHLRRDALADLAESLEVPTIDSLRQDTIDRELESQREKRSDQLSTRLTELRHLLEKSRDSIAFRAEAFSDAISASLQILKAKPLEATASSKALVPLSNPNEVQPNTSIQTFNFPRLDLEDLSWAPLMDSLRAPKTGEEFEGLTQYEWRAKANLRSILFTDPGIVSNDFAQFHLEHPVVQRLLSRFLSQGFIHHDLARACLAQSEDALPRVVLLARLSLYGQNAARLHEEILPLSALWLPANQRSGPLSPEPIDQSGNSLRVLRSVLDAPVNRALPTQTQAQLHATAIADLESLRPHLETRAKLHASAATKLLAQRADSESRAMTKIIETQRQFLLKQIEKLDGIGQQQLTLDFQNPEELRQLKEDRKHWQIRLDNIPQELEREPQRIRDLYEIRSQRIEPIGLVYLWPQSN